MTRPALDPLPWNAVGHRGPLTDPPTLAQLTTLGVGGRVARLEEPTSEAAFVDAVRRADEDARGLLVLGGGSNLLASDDPFDGVVVRDARREVRVGEADSAGSVLVTASAGTGWDPFVCRTLEAGLSGVEALSGIPGTVGAAPVQNVGAYGHEVGETLVAVRAWDRAARRIVSLGVGDLDLGYRTSRIKASLHHEDAGRVWGPTGRWVVLEVVFRLEVSSLSAPVRYGELARHLGVEVGERADTFAVREAVTALRRSKGMVLDAGDHDTWSAGSFFTNPILPVTRAEQLLPADAPQFPAGDGLVKSSAAWLISHAGFPRGWSVGEPLVGDLQAGDLSAGDARAGDLLAGGRAAGDPALAPAPQTRPTGAGGSPRASLSTRHVLALTNRGDASSADIVELARAVRDGVRERFGVTLVPEPVTLGLHI